MPYTYEYPRPSVTTDALVFRVRAGHIEIALIKRGHYPHEGMWALPGGFVDMDEPLETAAVRELREEAGIGVAGLRQLGAYGDPDRDPRTRIIAVAYYGWAIPGEDLLAGDDASEAQWYRVDGLPEMAFDHDAIIADALEAIRRGAHFGLEHCAMLGEPFSRGDFVALHKKLFGADFDAKKLFENNLAAAKIRAVSKDGENFEII